MFTTRHYVEVGMLLRALNRYCTHDDGSIHLSTVREALVRMFEQDNSNFKPQYFRDFVGPIKGVDEYVENEDKGTLATQAKAWAEALDIIDDLVDDIPDDGVHAVKPNVDDDYVRPYSKVGPANFNPRRIP